MRESLCTWTEHSANSRFLPLSPEPLHPFFFHDPATTEIYTLSLHDALPILNRQAIVSLEGRGVMTYLDERTGELVVHSRSEEHTSELQSLTNLVCRLLLEKKKRTGPARTTTRYWHRVRWHCG